MQLLSQEQIIAKKDHILYNITQGAVFLYPTDTVYSLGCSALDDSAVKRLRGIKESDKSFSVIAPSKKWILDNCEVSKDGKQWLDKLPGEYTLMMKLKNKDAVSNAVTNGDGIIGVRVIDHHFQDIVSDLGHPIVMTSANRIGKEMMINIDMLDTKIKSKVDFVLYEGEKNGKTSRIIDLTHNGKAVRE